MNLKFSKLIILFSIFYFLFSFLVPMVFAQSPPPQKCTPPSCQNCQNTLLEISCRKDTLFSQGGYEIQKETANFPARIGVTVDVAMSVAGIIFLAIVVFSGIQWMMAGGNEESVKKAKTRITRAIVGLIIVVGSWMIVNFVLKGLLFPSSSTGWGPFQWSLY